MQNSKAAAAKKQATSPALNKKANAREHSPQQTELQKADEINELLVNRLHDNLVRSQTSIIVTTAIAKLIQIRKEDKSFLNEALKQSVDKVILDQNFIDFDRPLPNFESV